MKSATLEGSLTKWNVPNVISFARLAAAPLLFAAAIRGQQSVFTWLLVASLMSDIADGLIARGFAIASEFGARLDSTADMAIFAVAVFGIVVFQADFLIAHFLPVSFVIALYVTEVAAALGRYGRISSFHTVLTRISAYAQGAFVVSLFVFGYSPAFFWLTVLVSVVAYGEELVIVWLLPQWEADVRGLYWILRQGRGRVVP
jgi:cardiolipin synthase (CMP-forming)